MTRLTSSLSWLTTAMVFTALSFTACDADTNPATNNGPDDEETFEYNNFALSADDEADDGFNEAADPSALLTELDDETGDDDSDALPIGDELEDVDLEPAPEGYVARNLLFVWGKPVLDTDFIAPVEWRGAIATTTGRVRPLRKIRFEGADELIRDQDGARVSFSTTTGPHNDGLLVRLFVPRGATGAVVFKTGVFEKAIPFAALADGLHKTWRVDDDANMVHVSTVPDHLCGGGTYRLRWERKNARGGIFGGKTFDRDGMHNGYVVGLWGRVAGKRRFKGVYLNADREFRGTLRGAYLPFPDAAGLEGVVMRGHWRRADGEVQGALAGVARVGFTAGQGVAMGHWVRRCDDQAGDCSMSALPSPGAAACAADQDENAVDVETCDAPTTTCVPIVADEPTTPSVPAAQPE